MKRVLVTALVLLAAGPALAHDLWLEPDPAGVKAVYGHAGEGGGADRYRLFEVKAQLPVGGAVSLLDAAKPGTDFMPPLALPAGAQGGRVVAARYDGGFWVKTAQGSRNTNRLSVPDALESRWSLKFAKLVLPGTQALGGALGHRLEIVPLADPYRLKTGEPLKVRVDLDAKPLAGAAITVGAPNSEAAAKVETDGAGVAEIAARPGLTLLSVSRKVAGSAPTLAAEDALAATLVYIR
ncbi:conserved exported protein of unknown function（Protein of unknown function DUF4198,17-212&|uniref:DUF4198 domain-containing protein n=1 Tax=Magnetospirillum sp. XM-1 TaxID=1663591 RepID=UPI00073DBEAB|nr:DUF4198 domain-containing protein [Magnetospirillum sp. XM-1]CUW38863.1 conserved exported protein of unknown function\